MMNHQFKITNADTDSISICKQNEIPFTEEEAKSLIQEINNISPEFMLWENDGNFRRFIVLKAKNYITYSMEGKLKTKGSALKDAKKEKALKEMLMEMIKSLLEEVNHPKLQEIYHKYIIEVASIKDISRWCSKRTLTEKIYTSERTNETKVLNLVEETEYVEGDRIYVFFKEDGDLELQENFNGEYSKDKFYEKIFKAVQIFENVLPIDTLFLNYKLKRNKKALDKLLGIEEEQMSLI